MTNPPRSTPTRNVVRDARGRGDSRRTFYLVLGLAVLVGVLALGYAWRRGKADTTAPPLASDAAPSLSTLGYVRGSPAAPIEIIEFGDFECPGCGEFATLAEPQIRRNIIDAGLARFRFIDLQVNQSHRNSPGASVAAACANEQGKFWEMHDRIFAGQAEWSSTAVAIPKPVFQRYAEAIGLDMKAWESCYDAQRHFDKLAVNADAARRIGLRYTPSLYIGKHVLVGSQPYAVVKAAVDSAITEAKAPPAGRE
jgi:protein-disulfide isomerase